LKRYKRVRALWEKGVIDNMKLPPRKGFGTHWLKRMRWWVRIPVCRVKRNFGRIK